MANTTVQGAQTIHGVNPQRLIETTIRLRIWETQYWKSECFALTAETIIDEAVKLRYIGGTYANTRPTEFLCLVLKLLQIQPDKEIIMEYLRAEEFKYLRALALFYIRLTFNAIDIYDILEPLLNDYRKLRYRAMDGSYSILPIDEFVDQLLTEERVCDIQLPRLTQRRVLEDAEGLGKRKSTLGKAMGVLGGGDEDESDDEAVRGRRRSSSASGSDRYVSRSPSRSRSRSASPGADGRYVSRSPSRSRSASPANADGRFVSRSPTRSPPPESN